MHYQIHYPEVFLLVLIFAVGCTGNGSSPSSTELTIDIEPTQIRATLFPTKPIISTSSLPPVTPTESHFHLPKKDMVGFLAHGMGDMRPELAFSLDGSILATGHQNGQIVLWDMLTGEKIHILSPITIEPAAEIGALSFSPDGTLIAVAYPWLSQISLWNVRTGEFERTLEGGYGLDQVGFSPNGRFLAGGVSRLQTFLVQVFLWDTESWTVQYNLKNVAPPFAFSDDGSLLVTASGATPNATGIENLQPGVVFMWELLTGQQLHTRQLGGYILGLDFDSERHLLAVSIEQSEPGSSVVDNIIYLIDSETDEVLRELKAYPEGAKQPLFGAVDLRFNNEASLLTACYQANHIVLWSVVTGVQVRIFESPGDELQHPVFSPDGTLLAASSSNGRILFWKLDF